MNAREMVALAPLIALIFVIGLFPNVFLSPHDAKASRRCSSVTQSSRMRYLEDRGDARRRS